MPTADPRNDPIEFEPPFTDEALALEIQQRQALLAERNERDQERAAAAERGRLERAFRARPVGPTTAGRLP